MKRRVALLLTIAVVAGLTPAAGARSKKPKAAPDVTYYLVPTEGECSLSTDPKLADPSRNCSRPADVATSAAPSEAVEMSAVDGLPLEIDAARPIRGAVTVWSSYLISFVGPIGAGEAQLTARLSGVTGGDEVVIGETTTDPYTVTPLSGNYTIEFEITPDEAVAGAEFDELTLTLHISGTTVEHGGFKPDGHSTLTLGVVRAR